MDEFECTPTLNTGLRGVEVASTRISQVDAKAGKLIYRGYLVAELAKNASFEEVVFLLLYERLPKAKELEDFSGRLKVKRALSPSLVAFLKSVQPTVNPMDVLQAGVALLVQGDPGAGDNTMASTLVSAEHLVAGIASLIAAWDRIRKGLEPVVPDDSLGHAENFLYMLTGRKPEPETTRFFDTALVLHAEHSFNASTFTARQVASTRAHIYAAVSAAIGSLSGELHGGANVRVMEMLKAIKAVENIDAYVNDALDAGKKIMGLGHAVYQVDDPRAAILAPMSKRMGEMVNQTLWYDISTRLEQTAKQRFKEKKGSDIFVNVDFYSASLFYAMGIPMDLFTPVFALARVPGWAAHVIEEKFATSAPAPALYRPGAAYVGDYCGPDECSFVDLDQR
ncbi:GltA4 [Desulforapulum autotrophicum HRM2]|uniref:Citrate synthase n=1 Tax=Desulforapulum autotrophicum (strain ATCC 43914 / DSM 3382 / VKM B-1955 / HRM2) TaxID=177437 RepID=C0QCE5_DESAH|nr:citrate/2-methylcitrate synthase [Desulforapulum autotrophicum]ACN17162.1 GltA4 [Desulforapulum autotrophicum HRM2]